MQTIIRGPSLTVQRTMVLLSCSQVGRMPCLWWRDAHVTPYSCDNLGHSACWGPAFGSLESGPCLPVTED